MFMCSCDKIFSENLEICQIKKSGIPAVCLPVPFLQFCFLVQQFPWLHKLPGIFLRASRKLLCFSHESTTLSVLQVSDNMSWDPGICKKIGS